MNRQTYILLATVGLFLLSAGIPRGIAAAEDDSEAERDGSASSDSADATGTSNSDEASDDQEDDSESSEDGDDRDTSDQGDDEASGEEDNREESEHGSYEWKPSYGGGIEYGLFYNSLDRLNLHLLESGNAPPVDARTVSSLTLSAEASLIEGSRITLFAGFEKPFSSNPNVLAVYGGLEPAFAFRRGNWEMALGIGIGIGSVRVSTESSGSLNAGLVTLRPVIELRRYVDEFFAAYARIGFNQWLPYNASGDGLSIRNPEESRPDLPAEQLLYEGGFFTSLGVRFGHYPEPVKRVPDSDDDGVRDDVDDCPETPEDQDGYEDYDGCPDEDNDGDGIKDENDECPDQAEDLDRWQDEDGCPDEAADPDGDGIINSEDECPKYAEDKDGYQDEDGCPDEDNDGDGIEDDNDECPDDPGIEAEDGCPSTIVTVDEERVVVEPDIRFQVPDDGPNPRAGSTLTDDSKRVLDELAAVLKLHDELKTIEIQGHTGEAGDAEAMQTLSNERADAVRAYLVQAGISGDRLVAEGYGFERPAEPQGAGEETDAQPKARITFAIQKRGSSDGESDSGGE